MRRVEWPTVGLIAGCTGLWLLATWVAGRHGFWPVLPLVVLTVTLHSSLQHEALHGHPTRNRFVNEALVFPPVGLFFPYRRFRTLHLKHHHDPLLTDPYEDPETNYFSAADWERMGPALQRLRSFNNTLLGRLTIGPALGIVGFVASDLRLVRAGDQRVLVAWALHGAGLVPVLWWIVGVCGLSLPTYALAVAYPGYALLTLRTFIEHRAAEMHPERTCVVEDPTGVFGLIFLNNNLHVVHHLYPTAPWYRLPALWREGRADFLRRNGGYHFPSYGAVVRAFFLRVKGPLEHPEPTWTRGAATATAGERE